MYFLKIISVVTAISFVASFSRCAEKVVPTAPIQAKTPQEEIKTSKAIVAFLDSSKTRVFLISKNAVPAKAVYATVDNRIEPTSVSQTSLGINTSNLLFDGNKSTFWFPGWSSQYYPMQCKVNFDGCKEITRVRVYDGAGLPVLTIKSDKGEALKVLLDGYNNWRDYEISHKASNLIIEIDNPSGNTPIGEIEFYGTNCDSILDPIIPIDPVDPPIINPPSEGPNSFSFGTNGFHWIPVNKLKGFNHLRQYIVWDWIESERGKYRFEPTAKADGNIDSHWAILKSNGIEPIACVNQSPAYIINTYPNPNPNYRPCANGVDPLKAESYLDFAKFWFQLAARYGEKKWPESVLSVDSTPRWTGEPTNVKKSGLGLLKYCEIWNEPDKWWLNGTPGNIEPEQYAAIMSACYDGHESKMGTYVGVKNADPNMKVVMAGLTQFDSAYIVRMSAWFKSNRSDKRFCADVMNFHHYTNEDGGIFKGREYGIAPEQDNIQIKMADITRVSNRVNPLVPIWWSEFGYDTNPSSPHYSRPTATSNSELIQGTWIARSFLEAMAAGFDAAHIYNAIDEPNPNGGLFQSSGILTGQNGNPKFSDKQGYSTVMSLINELSGFKLTYSNTSKDVRKMIFEKGDVIKMALWMPCEADCEKTIKVAGVDVRVSQTPKIITLFQ